jgi:hypothetical protein
MFIGGELRLLAGAQQPVDECAQPIRLLDDDARVLAQRPFRQLALEQLRGAADAAEGVFDLVGQTAHHHARGLLCAEEVLLAADAQQAIHRLQLDQVCQGPSRRAGG